MLRIGWAKTLFREDISRPDLVGRLTWDTDGFNELRGSLTAIKRQDPVTIIGSLVALSPETSMRFFVSTLHQRETKMAGSNIVGSDRSVASFVIGGSIVMMPGTLLNLSVGIGLTKDADDFSITLSLPIRI